jgi:hypothetical protein
MVEAKVNLFPFFPHNVTVPPLCDISNSPRGLLKKEQKKIILKLCKTENALGPSLGGLEKYKVPRHLALAFQQLHLLALWRS